jgi:outer membrane protein TolC
MSLSRCVSASLALVVLALASRARAESPTLPTMTLDEALAYAKAHQPALSAARARLEAAEHDLVANDREWYPKVTVGAQVVAGTVNPSSATALPFPGLNVARVGGTQMADPPTLRPYASTMVALGVRQEVFDFGRLAARERLLGGLERLERARASSAELDVAYLTASSYYAVLAAKQVLAAAESARSRSRAHRDLAEASTRAGLRPPIDLTRADADLARFEVASARAEGGVRAARSVLAAIVGAPETEIDAREEPRAVRTLPTVEQASQRAAEASPNVRRAEAVLRVQEAQVEDVESRTRPRVYLDGAIDGRGGGFTAPDRPAAVGAGFVPQVPNYDLGLVFVWPIWEPTASEAERAARARKRAAEEDLRGVRAAASQDARKERIRVEIAERTMTAIERSVAAATANAEQADVRFRSGLGTSLELSDAEGLRVEAEVQLAAARLEWMTARASLARLLSEIP